MQGTIAALKVPAQTRTVRPADPRWPSRVPYHPGNSAPRRRLGFSAPNGSPNPVLQCELGRFALSVGRGRRGVGLAPEVALCGNERLSGLDGGAGAASWSSRDGFAMGRHDSERLCHTYLCRFCRFCRFGGCRFCRFFRAGWSMLPRDGSPLPGWRSERVSRWRDHFGRFSHSIWDFRVRRWRRRGNGRAHLRGARRALLGSGFLRGRWGCRGRCEGVRRGRFGRFSRFGSGSGSSGHGHRSRSVSRSRGRPARWRG